MSVSNNPAVLENIFAHAVALDQSGRFKNMIHCKGGEIFVVNTDATAILHFRLPANSKGFPTPISFFANDYDSSVFYMENGKVVFKQTGQEFIRTKSCQVPKQTFDEAGELFDRYQGDMEGKKVNVININRKTLSLLDESLSHIEILSQGKKVVIRQRDIFSGNTINLRRAETGFGLTTAKDEISQDFGPIGIRTSDFMALFTFNDNVKLYFYPGNNNYFIATGEAYGFTAVIGGCVYDELNILEVIDHGREEQKDGGSESGPDTENQGKKPAIPVRRGVPGKK